MPRPESILEVAMDSLKKQIEDVEAFRRQHDRRCVSSCTQKAHQPERNCKTKTEIIRMQTRDMAALADETQKIQREAE